MIDEAPKKDESPPKVHDQGDTIFDALDNRDLDAIDAECRGLDLVQALAHYWIDEDTGETTHALSKGGIEEAGRKAGGVDCPIAGLRVEKDDEGGLWHAEQEGTSRESGLHRTGSASAKIMTKWDKPDRFGRRKAVSLAQRNAILALLTTRQKAEMTQEAIDLGSIEQIDPPWKKKSEDGGGRRRASRPAPRRAPKPEEPEAKPTPTKEEALDYYHGILGDLIADARGEVSKETRRDLIRAVTRRATDKRYNSGESMSLGRLVGVIRKIERSRDGVTGFLRGDDWQEWLGCPPAEPAEGVVAADARDHAPEAGEDTAGVEPPPPIDEEPEPEPQEPEDPKLREAAVDGFERAIAELFKEVPVEGIGSTAHDRQTAVDRVHTGMRKAIIREGVKDPERDSLDTLTVAEVSAVIAQMEANRRAIVKWLTTGRWLTRHGPEAAQQRDLLDPTTTRELRT